MGIPSVLDSRVIHNSGGSTQVICLVGKMDFIISNDCLHLKWCLWEKFYSVISFNLFQREAFRMWGGLKIWRHRWRYLLKLKTCEILNFEGGISNASATLGVQDGAERGRGGGKPRLPHGKKSKRLFPKNRDPSDRAKNYFLKNDQLDSC